MGTERSWTFDGFRVRFAMRALPIAVRAELGLLYAGLAALAALGLGDVLVGVLLLLPPPVVVWWATRRPLPAELHADHQRLVASAPLRGRTEIPLREIRSVEIYDSALELELWGGDRVRVPAPADDTERVWVARQLRALIDDAQAFALDLTQQLDAAWAVKSLSRRPRGPAPGTPRS